MLSFYIYDKRMQQIKFFKVLDTVHCHFTEEFLTTLREYLMASDLTAKSKRKSCDRQSCQVLSWLSDNNLRCFNTFFGASHV